MYHFSYLCVSIANFFLVDCSFSRGVCDWKQDTSDDFDWNPADRDRGIYLNICPLAQLRFDVLSSQKKKKKKKRRKWSRK